MALDIPNSKEIFKQRDVRETPSSTQTQTQTNLAPIGAILPWLKSFTNTPVLISGWEECNGQVLSDGDSVYDGQTLPDLNGNNNFLRGNSTSGATGGSETMAHTHSVTSNVTAANHAALTIANHANLVISNHTALTINNHTALTLSNHTIGNESSHTHTFADTSTSQSATETIDLGSGTDVADAPHTHDISGTTGAGSSHTHSIGAHSFSQNIDAHGFGQNISAHSISTNIDAHSITQNIDAHDLTNNAVTSGAASNAENRPPFYNVVWIMRVK